MVGRRLRVLVLQRLKRRQRDEKKRERPPLKLTSHHVNNADSYSFSSPPYLLIWLQRAVEGGHHSLVYSILMEHSQEIKTAVQQTYENTISNWRTKHIKAEKRTPMYRAVKLGYLELTKLLMAYDLVLETDHKHALMAAIKNGREQIISFLVDEKRWDTSVLHSEDAKVSPLHWAGINFLCSPLCPAISFFALYSSTTKYSFYYSSRWLPIHGPILHEKTC